MLLVEVLLHGLLATDPVRNVGIDAEWPIAARTLDVEAGFSLERDDPLQVFLAGLKLSSTALTRKEQGEGTRGFLDDPHGSTMSFSAPPLQDLDDLVEVAADGPIAIGHPREGAMRRVCHDGRVRDGEDRAGDAPGGVFTEAAEDDAIADVYAVHGLSIPFPCRSLHAQKGGARRPPTLRGGPLPAIAFSFV